MQVAPTKPGVIPQPSPHPRMQEKDVMHLYNNLILPVSPLPKGKWVTINQYWFDKLRKQSAAYVVRAPTTFIISPLNRARYDTDWFYQKGKGFNQNHPAYGKYWQFQMPHTVLVPGKKGVNPPLVPKAKTNSHKPKFQPAVQPTGKRVWMPISKSAYDKLFMGKDPFVVSFGKGVSPSDPNKRATGFNPGKQYNNKYWFYGNQTILRRYGLLK